MNDDSGNNVLRSLLVGLAALVAVTLVVGGVVAAVALGVTRVIGLGEEQDQASGPGPSLYIPSTTPSDVEGTPEVAGLPGGPASSAPGGSGEGKHHSDNQDKNQHQNQDKKDKDKKDKEHKKKQHKQRAIALSASPRTVGEMERIDLTGAYRSGEGATLQVQRLEGGSWAVFPVTATVRGGTFSTYVQTGRAGQNRFRVVDTGSGRKSKPVTVTVR